MAKSKKVQADNDEDASLINDKEEISDDIIVEEESGIEEEADAGIELSEIPIEEFMKDPEKMAKITDEAESEESTNWCPRCSDHTIFVDRVCTVCGFTKGSKKADDKDDDEDSTDFEILPDDDIIGDLGYEYEDEESFD
jgi:hypothetical protein